MFKSYTPTECIVVPMALRWHFCRIQRGDGRRGEGSLTQYRAAPCMALTPATKPRTVMGKRMLEPLRLVYIRKEMDQTGMRGQLWQTFELLYARCSSASYIHQHTN
jgi:hypothetical protein